MIRRFFLAILAAATLAQAAQAQSLGFGLGFDNRGKAGGGGGAPFVIATGVYSFRKVLPSYAGAPIRLRRASDSAQQDIPFAGSDFDTAAATTFCAATSCFVVTWYDQAPAAQNITQAGAAAQPPLQFSCIGSLPCINFNSISFSMASPVVSQTGVVTLNVVMNRTTGTAICVLPGVGTNSIKTRSGVAGLNLAGSVGSITTSSAENTWHSATGVINAASSSIVVDGTTTTGSLTGSASSANISISGNTATTCFIAEMAFWQAYAMPAAEIAALNTDQHAYWGF